MEDRDPIILNDRHQPVGPTKAIKRYIAPEEGKGVHYTNFQTMEERLAHQPDLVLEQQWKEIMLYWDSLEAREISKKNKENRQKQGDMHTMGSSSYSMLRHELQQNDPNKREPSLADICIESRKRKVGRTYLTPNDETLQNIEKMKALKAQDDGSGTSDPYFNVITKKEHSGHLRLHGRGVTKSSLKKEANTPFVLPLVFLESITQQLEKKLEDQLESKVSYTLSKIREANPGIDVVIPDFQTMEGDASSPHDNVGESMGQSHPPQS